MLTKFVLCLKWLRNCWRWLGHCSVRWQFPYVYNLSIGQSNWILLRSRIQFNLMSVDRVINRSVVCCRHTDEERMCYCCLWRFFMLICCGMFTVTFDSDRWRSCRWVRLDVILHPRNTAVTYQLDRIGARTIVFVQSYRTWQWFFTLGCIIWTFIATFDSSPFPGSRRLPFLVRIWTSFCDIDLPRFFRSIFCLMQMWATCWRIMIQSVHNLNVAATRFRLFLNHSVTNREKKMWKRTFDRASSRAALTVFALRKNSTTPSTVPATVISIPVRMQNNPRIDCFWCVEALNAKNSVECISCKKRTNNLCSDRIRLFGRTSDMQALWHCLLPLIHRFGKADGTACTESPVEWGAFGDFFHWLERCRCDNHKTYNEPDDRRSYWRSDTHEHSTSSPLSWCHLRISIRILSMEIKKKTEIVFFFFHFDRNKPNTSYNLRVVTVVGYWHSVL